MTKAKEISRRFRPQHKDIEVILEDGLGGRVRMYIALATDSEPDVDSLVRERLGKLDEQKVRIERILTKAKVKES